MKRFTIMAAVVLCVLLVGSCAHAAVWTSSNLYNSMNAETLLLTPSFTLSGSSYVYSYDLTNNTTTDEITGFILTIPTAASVSTFSDFVTPTGWTKVVATATNQIQWYLTTQTDGLKPQQTQTFGFTTAFGPSASKVAGASCQDSWGFSGNTFGPVPEPTSLVAFASGLIGLVGLKLRRR